MTWSTEEIFIEKVVDSNLIVIDLKNAISYLKNKDSNFQSSYQLWSETRDEIISELLPGEKKMNLMLIMVTLSKG